jgi:hypothetical protein
MDTTVAQLYRIHSDTVLERAAQTIARTLARLSPDTSIPTFFRADDVGVPSQNFFALIETFARRRMVLCLAVVPAWLTRSRWEAVRRCTDPHSHLWCWHQHGWNHANHERTGKKCEFGPSRSAGDLRSDLRRGRQRLETIMGAEFSPFFTPPWNRCSSAVLDLLLQLGFHGVSRSGGEQKTPAPLPDCFINVDLHTRKEPDPASSLDNLCSEFERAIRCGHLGIMLHHQRMNDGAFAVLDGLLAVIAAEPRLQPVDFNHFIETGPSPR